MYNNLFNLLSVLLERSKKRLSRRTMSVLTLMLSIVWKGFVETVIQNMIGDKPSWFTYLLSALLLTTIAVALFILLEFLDELVDLGLDDEKGDTFALST